MAQPSHELSVRDKRLKQEHPRNGAPQRGRAMARMPQILGSLLVLAPLALAPLLALTKPAIVEQWLAGVQ